MALGIFPWIQTGSEAVDRLQSKVRESLRQVLIVPHLSGREVKDLAIVTGTAKTLNHGLGRVPRGWIVVDKNAEADVWATSKSKKVLVLNSSANVTVDLWVY